jgi:hypothetical protein
MEIFKKLVKGGSFALATESAILAGNSFGWTTNTTTDIQNLGDVVLPQPAGAEMIIHPSIPLSVTPNEPININIHDFHTFVNGTSTASVHISANSLNCVAQDYSGLGSGLNKVMSVTSGHAANVTAPSGFNLQFSLQNQNNLWILHVNQVVQNSITNFFATPHAFMQALHTLTPFIEASIAVTIIGGAGLAIRHMLRKNEEKE